jgi:hypothetical protein
VWIGGGREWHTAQVPEVRTPHYTHHGLQESFSISIYSTTYRAYYDKLLHSCYLLAPSRNCMTYCKALKDFPGAS